MLPAYPGLGIWGVGFPGVSGKEPARRGRSCKRSWFDSWVRKIPWRWKWPPIPVFLPRKSHAQKELGGLQSTEMQRVQHNWSDLAQAQSEVEGLSTGVRGGNNAFLKAGKKLQGTGKLGYWARTARVGGAGSLYRSSMLLSQLVKNTAFCLLPSPVQILC